MRKQLEGEQRVTRDVAAMNTTRRPDPAATLAAATAYVPPALTPLDAPTERAGEPVTAGLAIGAGSGPEALGQFAPGGPDPDLVMLLRHLPILELVSSGSSVASRNLIRRLRGSVPMPGTPQAQDGAPDQGGGGGAVGRGGPAAPPVPFPSSEPAPAEAPAQAAPPAPAGLPPGVI